MDKALKAKFVEQWSRYFNAAELPLAFYYTDQTDDAELVPAPVSPHLHDRRAGESEKRRITPF